MNRANLTRGVIFVLAVLLSSHGTGHAQRGAEPFERLAGQWAGSGTIDLSNGTRERIKCRASYDALEERHNLQLSIRCASDSFNLNLNSTADLAGRAISVEPRSPDTTGCQAQDEQLPASPAHGFSHRSGQLCQLHQGT